MQTPAGRFAGMDFGGEGGDCLLLHGTGQNVEAWRAFAARLARTRRVVAFDLRGHGQTPEASADAAQFWRDIGAVCDGLGFAAPTLIGHSTGAWAATAHAASGGRCAALVCIDGFTLDAADDLRRPAATIPEADLFRLFRYGWVATTAERDAYIEEEVAKAPSDGFNRGIDAALLRAMLWRCFAPYGEKWLRRPTMEEIATVSAPPPIGAVRPTREVYDRIDAPVALIWASDGLSNDRRGEVEAIAAQRANRRFAALEGTHNLPMQRPEALSHAVAELLAALE